VGADGTEAAGVETDGVEAAGVETDGVETDGMETAGIDGDGLQARPGSVVDWTSSSLHYWQLDPGWLDDFAHAAKLLSRHACRGHVLSTSPLGTDAQPRICLDLTQY
jgi:hypothetical protein